MPHKPNKSGETNQKRVKRFLDFSPYAMLIVCPAIAEKCQWILDNQERVKTDPGWNNDMFIGNMWIQSAKDWFEMNPEYQKK